MNQNIWARCVVAILVVGCEKKLEVDTSPPNTAGAGAREPTNASGGARGLLGTACLPSETVTEASGSVAEARILELARCSDGLACGPAEVCTEIPDCPNAAGACVFYRAALGAGGTGGVGGGEDAFGGNGIGGNGEPVYVAHDRQGVQGIAADDSNLYWVEYGTRDSLGNYQNDGAFYSLPLAGGASHETISLAGPVALGVTSSHAYVYLDGGPLLGNVIRPRLIRVSLTDGGTEEVQDGTNAIDSTFVGVGDTGFWTKEGKLYEQGPDGAVQEATFASGWIGALATDGRSLFYADSSGIVWRAARDGSTPQAFALSVWPFQPSGDFIYWLEGIDNIGTVLDRALVTSDSGQRVRALGGGSVVGSFQIIGDRFFVASNPHDPVNSYIDPRHLSITTGLLSSSDPPVRLVEARVPTINQAQLWVATASAVYWSDGRAIYMQPVTGAP